MATIGIVGGRLVDPSQNLDGVADLWIVDGAVHAIDPGTSPPDATLIRADGRIVTPGFVDLHAHFREPGGDADETIADGSRAAVEGGYTSVAAMPDTEPAIDNQAAAEFVLLQARRAGHCHVWPVGAVTKGRGGVELAELGGLVQGGAVAFTDAPTPIASAEIMRRALEYAQMFDRPVFNRPEVPELARDGVMNEGVVSVALGLPGIPSSAEEIMVDRDLHLAKWTGGRLHLQSISAVGSLGSIRRGKATGIRVTADTCPHYFALTDEALRSFDSHYKVSPPLRSEADRTAVLDALADGTIDAIASGHAPWAVEKKLRELDIAPFGVIGLETVLPIAIRELIEPGVVDWPGMVRLLSTRPAQILGLDRGSLAVGKSADVTILDPAGEWTIDPNRFRSRSRNTPFAGFQVRGRAMMVLVDGIVRFDRGANG